MLIGLFLLNFIKNKHFVDSSIPTHYVNHIPAPQPQLTVSITYLAFHHEHWMLFSVSFLLGFFSSEFVLFSLHKGLVNFKGNQYAACLQLSNHFCVARTFLFCIKFMVKIFSKCYRAKSFRCEARLLKQELIDLRLDTKLEN